MKKDGTVIWVHDEALVIERDDEGRPTRSQGVMYDVTERKHAEHVLAETEARYRTLVERVPVYVFENVPLDDVSSTLYVSPQIQAIWGYTQQEWTADPADLDRCAAPGGPGTDPGRAAPTGVASEAAG